MFFFLMYRNRVLYEVGGVGGYCSIVYMETEVIIIIFLKVEISIFIYINKYVYK
jgi:hypothetical protein